MTGLTPEDIAAARQEGDLVALLLMSGSLTPAAPKRRTNSAAPAEVHIAHPGAWPTGSTRPAPVPAPDGRQIEAALTDYRRWLVSGHSTTGTHCPCAGCTR